MMERFKRVWFYLLLALVVLPPLVGIGLVQKRMNTIIKEKKLTDTDPVENAPPIVAFTTIALGSFRGILADVLWLRATTLQDQGKYFEMVQLASWITKLQPRFTGATAYLAWNMAYNISVTCSSFADRWRWVRQGIELIRDEALNYNPSDPLLYKELGWIYQHKIGNIMDDANIYYKRELALEMMKAFGAAEPDWGKFAQAPKTFSDLLHSLGEKNNLEQILSNTGFSSLKKLENNFRLNGGLPEKLSKALRPPERDALTLFLRVKVLRTYFKLDPSTVIEINEKYGKLDFRLPEAYAIYWATMGLKCAPDHHDINCERMITQSLKDAFMGGRLLMVDKDSGIITIPNLNVVDAVRKSYIDAYKTHKSSSFHSALMNFTKDAIVVLYNFGNYSKAKEYYKYLREEEPNKKDYMVSLDLFVLKEWAEDVKDATMRQAHDIISGLIYRSCFFLAYGDHAAAEAHERLAKFVYQRYQRSNEGALERVGLPPFSEMKSRITQGCLRNFPPALRKNLSFAIEQMKDNQAETKKKDL